MLRNFNKLQKLTPTDSYDPQVGLETTFKLQIFNFAIYNNKKTHTNCIRKEHQTATFLRIKESGHLEVAF